MRQSISATTPFAALIFSTLTTAQGIGPVLTSSFTWNAKCGPTVACGPAAAGFSGTGFAAANNVTFAAGQPIEGGKGAGCGQCWHLEPQSDAYKSNGLTVGTPVVVKINDQCTDPKYCDQEEFGNNTPLNTGYRKQVHFDLCDASGVTKQFFGQVNIGVLLGVAQQVDCSQLDNGPFGSQLGKVSGGSTAASTENEKSSSQRVDAGQNNMVVNGGSGSGSSSSTPGGVQSTSTTPVVAGQPSTTLATVVSSTSPSTSSVPGGGDGDSQDECDEL